MSIGQHTITGTYHCGFCQNCGIITHAISMSKETKLKRRARSWIPHVTIR